MGASVEQHYRHNVFRVPEMAAHSPSASPHREKSVHTHQHIRRAVNRMQDGLRETASHVVSYPLYSTATVNILCCSITHVCHTCCLYDDRLYSHTVPTKKLFCNRLYLKMFCRWLCLYVDVFHKCNKGKPGVQLPSLSRTLTNTDEKF